MLLPLSFPVLGFALLLLQQAWMSWRSLHGEWDQIIKQGVYPRRQGCRYRPHPEYRVVEPA